MTAPLDPYVLDLVRKHDRPRFAVTMFAPEVLRDRILTVLAFNLELARIPRTVSEPMLGQMRLQWWRDLVEGLAAGRSAPAGHPVAQSLAAAIPGLKLAPFLRLIDCREPLLAGDGALAAVEPEAEALTELLLRILGVDDAATSSAARDAGIAYGLAALGGLDQAAHVREHIAAARAQRGSVDRRAIPVLLWATLAEATLRGPAQPLPVLTLMWRAWRGRY